MTDDDETFDWALLWFCGALGLGYQQVWDLVQADEDHDGWVKLFDPDLAPVEGLAYLGQFAGVQLESGFTEEQKREAIRTPAGFRRGTLAAMISAIQRTLTGSMVVSIIERDGSAYLLTVTTYTPHTPDPDATEKAAISQKPAGIVMTYVTADGQTYNDLEADFTDYDDVESSFADYNEVRTTIP